MKLETQNNRIDLPEGIKGRLQQFRRLVRLIKIAEGVAAAMFGLALSYFILFGLDRIWDTPSAARWTILCAGSLGLGIFLPLKLHRWIWRQRKLEQVARLLRKSFPSLGDQLLGIVELAKGGQEQECSQTLVLAAMRQVDDATSEQDFSRAVPDSRHGRWAFAALTAISLAAAALFAVPAAGWNAFHRWSMPWKNIERYTFAELEGIPERIVVPLAESFSINARLADTSKWKPASAKARYLDQSTIRATAKNNVYTFNISPQRDPGQLKIQAGDDREVVAIKPMSRPELESLKAIIDLPDYLQYSSPVNRAGRSGTLSILRGSRTQIEATISRDLRMASVDGNSIETDGNSIGTDWIELEESRTLTFNWRDIHGLEAKEPLELKLAATEDKAPTIRCVSSLHDRILLEDEVATFDITASDDFGIRKIGLQWEGLTGTDDSPEPQKGEKPAAAGAPESRDLSAKADFNAKNEGVRPQMIRIRAFAEDYLPDRPRSFSEFFTLHILSSEEHAMWIAEQLYKWRRQAVESYETEIQLNQRNKEFRALSAQELDQPGIRREIEKQANAESSNARQLGDLTDIGEELVRQATRNPDFEGDQLEQWAQMLQSLKNIAEKRMPSVADMLAKASDAPAAKNGKSQEPSESAPTAKSDKSQASSASGESKVPSPGKVPSIKDIESSLAESKQDEAGKKPPSQSGPGRLTLPTTTIPVSKPKQDSEPESPAGEQVAQAIEEQDKLIEEFAKVVDEIEQILLNLEGSTFVKRLKAASREQMSVAGDLDTDLLESFGTDAPKLSEKRTEKAASIAENEMDQSEKIQIIQEDLDAFVERVQEPSFQEVLDQMALLGVVNGVSAIGFAVRDDNHSGQSIAAAEFWADKLDIWADNLAAFCESCKSSSGGPQASLPPAVILEVMRILQGEIELRESTRSLEQARSALATDEYGSRAIPLQEKQGELAERTLDVVEQIQELPEAWQFANESGLLKYVSRVMKEAEAILSEPNTGRRAIAAETEAIELLLQAKKASGQGGGGSGLAASPGGGGQGTTDQSALALIGQGDDTGAQVKARKVGQATGAGGAALPAEFRNGLDAYFNALEKGER